MSIFVSIASYRDVQCKETISSMFLNARWPENIVAGICEQNLVGSDCETCTIPSAFEKQVRTIRIRHNEAKGPTFARYLCASLWKNERYFMQIDSHTLFVKDWDEIAIQMFEEEKELYRDGSSMFVISYYPLGFDNISNDMKQVPQICKALINDMGMVSQHGAEMVTPEDGKPLVVVPFIAGGFMFTEAKPFLETTPFDPFLDHLFVGEEFLLAARLYTNGWDIVSPSKNIVFHHYTRAGSPKFWDSGTRDADSLKRAKYILKLSASRPRILNQDMDLYGLGDVRTIDDFWDFTGIDWNSKNVIKDFCHPERNGTYSKDNTFYFSLSLFFILIAVFFILLLKRKN